jgi:hypothetical protein
MTALEVHLGGVRHVVESAPMWGRPDPDRGVVVEGPVGLAWLGRWKPFRYEIRRWRDGVIPDAAEAVDSPKRISTDRDRARRTVGPRASRPAPGGGTNSVLVTCGTPARSSRGCSSAAVRTSVRSGGRPGWTAGVVAASEHHPPASRGADGRPAASQTSHPDELFGGRKGGVRRRSLPAGQERP